MRELQEQVRTIRRNAEDEFHNLQNRYQQAFAADALYTREKLGKPFDYNPTNPDESARLVYERASDLMRQVCEQIKHKANDERLSVQSLPASAALHDSPDEELHAVEANAHELMSLAEQAETNAADYLGYAKQEDIIRDFPAPGAGRFTELLHMVIGLRDDLGDISKRSKGLSQRITASSLSSDEEALLQQLQSNDLKPLPICLIGAKTPISLQMNSGGYCACCTTSGVFD